MRKKNNIVSKSNIKIMQIIIIVSILLVFASILMIILFFVRGLQKVEKDSSIKIYNKREFIEQVNIYAQKNYKKYNILPSLTISQAILESDWGKSELSSKYHNYFGIKSIDKNDNKVVFETKEYVDNKQIEIKDAFRVFESMEDSVNYHGLLLGTAKIYEKVVKSEDYIQGANMLYECGYATDPYYAQKLINIIEEYKLYEYDKEI